MMFLVTGVAQLQDTVSEMTIDDKVVVVVLLFLYYFAFSHM